MHALLRNLPPGALVLDLGSARGSFAPGCTQATVIALDRDISESRPLGAYFVCGDASRLPFAGATFHGVISNHSLEHFCDLSAALEEIRRVLRPGGFFYAAVPDASTVTDRLYRWLANGGGHVNAFVNAQDLAQQITQATGLPHAGRHTLYSSLAFLNCRNAPRPLPRKLHLLGGGREWTLFLYVLISRRLDQWFGWRTSVYGWALYFGAAEPIEAQDWKNVCIRCGSGFPAAELRPLKVWGIAVYRCPGCGATNPYFGH